MFKITSLTLFDPDGRNFTYEFSVGVNYIHGKNDSGKTEFYEFLDFMFGKGIKDLADRRWYNGFIKSAVLELEYNGITYKLSRDISGRENYLYYGDEEPGEALSPTDYRARVNAIFAIDRMTLEELRTFSDEDIGYRTFTLFNFWGENRQGQLVDFFYKCAELRYQIKLPLILNYIFNPNLKQIFELKQKANSLEKQLENLERHNEKNKDLRARINRQLRVLNAPYKFTGSNSGEIWRCLRNIQELVLEEEKRTRPKTIAELETIYTSLREQLKVEENAQKDHQSFAAESKHRKALLEALQALVKGKKEYDYLISPIVEIVHELDKSISFNRYVIKGNTVNALKKEIALVKEEIEANEARFTAYTVQDKTKAVMLISDYLSQFEGIDDEHINEVKQDLRKIREEIRLLQAGNDSRKTQRLSADITQLYEKAKDVSEIVGLDFRQNGFEIKYIKTGNILQPQIAVEDEDVGELQGQNYYTGSMARHTLIQLCGYLGFLRMLVREKKYPLIPILVIDHISKPFDAKNGKAIGAILNGAYSDLTKGDFQIFLFEDEPSTAIGVNPDKTIELTENGRTGFSPFYQVEIDSENSED